MSAPVAVKICGLRDSAQVRGAVEAGARYLGFNFFACSPRSVSVEQASALAADVPAGVARVALVVNEDDAGLDRIVRSGCADILQLHGSESPARVSEVRTRFGLPVMKAIGIAQASDLHQIDVYSEVADLLLIDAKAPKDAVLPGGNGLSFDWTLIQRRKYWTKPWMLAGGLTPDNVAEAVARTGAQVVDVASGVETAPGVKDDTLMRAFMEATRGAASGENN